MITELIGFFILSNLHVGPVMVLGYFIFRFISWDGFKLFFNPNTTLNTEPLDARGVTACILKKKFGMVSNAAIFDALII